MNRFLLAILISSLSFLCADLRAQESAKVQITLKISAKTPSFKDQRLVVILYRNIPGQEDRGDAVVARHVDAKFSHQKGSDTQVTITLGEKEKRKQSVRYTFSANVFDDASKVTHASEMNGRTGPFPLLADGTSSKVAILLSPVR